MDGPLALVMPAVPAPRGDGPPGAADTAPDAVLRARAGDRDAFSHLVREHQDAVFAAAWRMTRSREDAEDIAQETFVRAWRSLPGFDVARPLRPWLLAIAVNVARTRLAAAARRPRVVSIDPTDPAEEAARVPAPGSVVEDVVGSELHARFRGLLASLPADDALLYHLRYGEDRPVAEIAGMLDRRPNAVAVALHRLRARLRDALFNETPPRDRTP